MDDFDFDFDELMDFGTPEFDFSNMDFSGANWDDFLGDFTTAAGDTGWDDFLGTDLPTFGNLDLSEALAGSESDISFNKMGDMVFQNPDGTTVTYTADGMVRTEDPSGRNMFYHTTDGRDYAVDYSSLTPGDLVETFGRDTTGGPTRYSAYHTTDGRNYFVDYTDAFTPGELVETFGQDVDGGPTRYTAYSKNGVADYEDVFGGKDKKITTTTGDGKKTTVYEDGKTKTVTNNVVNEKVREILKTITETVGGKDNAALIAALLGGLAGLSSRGGGGGGGGGFKGTIPKYTATRGPVGSPTAGGRRAGGAGLGSLTGGVTYAAQGGIMDLAVGGKARPARYLAGGTDGMADKIQTDIEGEQPARLSHGEFVIPADVVSHLGNGNSDAGANVLYDMMAKVRKARTGNEKQGKQINPHKFVPGKGR